MQTIGTWKGHMLLRHFVYLYIARQILTHQFPSNSIHFFLNLCILTVATSLWPVFGRFGSKTSFLDLFILMGSQCILYLNEARGTPGLLYGTSQGRNKVAWLFQRELFLRHNSGIMKNGTHFVMTRLDANVWSSYRNFFERNALFGLVIFHHLCNCRKWGFGFSYADRN